MSEQSLEVGPERDLPEVSASPSRVEWFRRLLGRALAVTAVILAILVLPPWLRVIIPRWLIRGVNLAFLNALFISFWLAIPTSLLGLLLSLASLGYTLARERKSSARTAARWAMLCASVLLGLFCMELITRSLRQQKYRLADLPTRLERNASVSVADEKSVAVPRVSTLPAPEGAGRGGWRTISLVVVGESSARGEPYHPWVSVGQLVAWQLQRVFPGAEIRVEVYADGGLCLEQAINLVAGIRHRPDALIVFAGHNEFQTRFGWSRNVRHYVEEGPESPLALVELARVSSSTAELILESIDRFRGEARPPDRVTRELVDHPTCTAKEHEFLRREFERRLDGLVAWCVRERILPILIVPAGNDAGFDPSRSVLDGETPEPDRREFARQVESAREAELADPESAISAYRRLIDRHPEFSETHYRLGRLLRKAGRGDEAREHFIAARDLDGLPLRCPSDFQQTIRVVAGRYAGLLIDAQRILARSSPDEILDDRYFHDGQHVNLAGQVALAEEILDQLKDRRFLGWPASSSLPPIEIGDCVRSFGLDAAKWAEVCRRSAGFYARCAYVRFDPADRLVMGGRYAKAAEDITSGKAVAETGPRSLEFVPVERAKDRSESP